MTYSHPFLRDEMPGRTVVSACGITLDIGRQRIKAQMLEELARGAQERKALRFLRAMMKGAVVNVTENRQVLHTALRDPAEDAPHHAEVKEALDRACAFADAVRSGAWKGSTGKAIRSVIAIGIGGSELGPRAVNHALRPAASPLRVHFLAAVDGVTLDRILAQCDPEATLVIMTSKSFKTRETQVNGEAVLEWMKAGGVAGPALARHLVVCSAKPSAARELGLPGENFYPMWDWVGGRFPLRRSVCLPVILCIGSERFREFLAGAHAMDQHALKAPALRNLPMLLALLSWYNHVEYDMHMHAFLPYDERLRTLVLWLQQLEMESLGKNRQPDGTPVVGVTGQGVWGGHGNESQHSFYQWIREGTCRCSIDICWCARPGHSHQHMHDVLNANARAQADALVTRDFNDVFNALSTLEIDELTPATLGALMAMYEHKTALLGALFHINAFDQPGVEYGKQLCRELEASLREQLQSQPPAPIE